MTLRKHRKAKLVTAISMALGSLGMSAQAALTTSSTLEFDAGFTFVADCAAGVINPTTGT